MAQEKTYTQADIDAARAAAMKEGEEKERAAAAAKLAEAEAKATASAKAAQERVLAILGHEEAVGRTELAKKLAASSMSVDEAVDMLKAAPKQEAKGTLANRMANVPNPKVGAAPEASAQQPNTINAQDIFAKRRAQAGHAK